MFVLSRIKIVTGILMAALENAFRSRIYLSPNYLYLIPFPLLLCVSSVVEWSTSPIMIVCQTATRAPPARSTDTRTIYVKCRPLVICWTIL